MFTRIIPIGIALFPTIALAGSDRSSDPTTVFSTAEGCSMTVSGTDIVFSGCNVHVQNGSPSTSSSSINGLGNLIVGYNEQTSEDVDRSGSHNMVIGADHSYQSWGGMLAGSGHTTSAPAASAIGGYDNSVSEPYAIALGGQRNTADGRMSIVVGGQDNETLGRYSVVSGGARNQATGMYSATFGGILNSAEGMTSVVTGGMNNVSSGPSALVTGGQQNIADGNSSLIAGGKDNTAEGGVSVVVGGKDQFTTDNYELICMP